jgi:hypothetical protein
MSWKMSAISDISACPAKPWTPPAPPSGKVAALKLPGETALPADSVALR